MAQTIRGKVYLVGAGPGDPGLLTLKGKECLSRADVVVYDYLANPSFLKDASAGAELIYVGKKGGCHTMNQSEINKLIIEKTRAGKTVVRLKGGDPFIFGRGGEEAQELADAGLDFEVVPGVTSAIAVPAYAGIPLTHREFTPAVSFITGHEDPQKEKSAIPWEKIATGGGTLVFLMGVGNLVQISEALMAHGRSPDTPVAIIQNGTFPEQKTLTGRLGDIAPMARAEGIRAPAVIVVGEVVHLRKDLNWFEKRPLFGKRIVITRAREQASQFLRELSDLGAECIEFPTIEVVPPESWEPLDKAILSLDGYQWLIFTSVNGVKYFLRRLGALGKDVRDLKGVKIAAIGPKTAEAWTPFGIKPDLMPDEYRAEAVVESLRNWDIKGARILLPRAARAREILPEELRKMGAVVDVVAAYRTVKPDHDTARVKDLLQKGAIHMVTFTSSSTVTNFLEMFEGERRQLLQWMGRVVVACIGPVTAKTAREQNLQVQVVAPSYTIESLKETIVRYFGSNTSEPESMSLKDP